MTHRIFITGAAGYIGGMLCEIFSRGADVACIVALDKEPMPEQRIGDPKIRWIRANTADPSWQAAVAEERPDVVIHAAWQIREIYGQDALQREWNVFGSEAVFDFSFVTPSVKRLIYLSTVASYGAEADNRIEHLFKETDEFRASDFRYAEEKRLTEASLERKFAQACEHGREFTVVVLRPAAVVGPLGRQKGAGTMQSALTQRQKPGVFSRALTSLTAFIPVTPNWCRQFVHEDDVADIAALMTFGDLKQRYETFNVCAPGEVLRGEDLAAAFRKRAVLVHPQWIRLAFFVLWHATRGRVVTPPGAWKSYCYPIAVDGAKLTDKVAFEYRMGSKDALARNVGRYARGPAPHVAASAVAMQARV